MQTPQMENVTFDELKVGQSASLSRTLSERESAFGGVMGHGMWTGALISSLSGTTLSGPDIIYLNQNLDFEKPVRPG